MTAAQCPACGTLPALSGEPNCDCWQGAKTSEGYYSDEALAKQAALEALPEGTRAPWSMLLGIYEPRVKATDAERCNCCGLDARDNEGGAVFNGRSWCLTCIGRGHHEEDE